MSASTPTESRSNPVVRPAAIEAPAWDAQAESGGGRWKLWAALGTLAALVIFALIIWGLYSLGDSDQSSLERFRDIAIIFIILISLAIVILLAGITAALAYLVLTIKDRVIPLLEDVGHTTRQLTGTTQFMTEEAVKPLLGVAGTVAKIRAMSKTVVTGNKRRKS